MSGGKDTQKPLKSNEWFTPSRYIEAARLVMGGIDLDPASCEQANRVVQATQYYSQAENGLMQPWFGRVWLNAPYGRCEWHGEGRMSYQSIFAGKLLREYAQGNIEQAVLLSLGNPNSKWFQPFFEFPICFKRDRIHFDRPDGSSGHFGFPLAFIYLGPHERRFIEIFSRFGRVVRAVDTSAPKPMTVELWAQEAYL